MIHNLSWYCTPETMHAIDGILESILHERGLYFTREETSRPVQQSFIVHSDLKREPRKETVEISQRVSEEYAHEKYLPWIDRVRHTLPHWSRHLPFLQPRYHILEIEKNFRDSVLAFSGVDHIFHFERRILKRNSEIIHLVDQREWKDWKREISGESCLEAWKISLHFRDQISFEKSLYSDYHEGFFSLGSGFDTHLPPAHFHYKNKPLQEAVQVFGKIFDDHQIFLEK